MRAISFIALTLLCLSMTGCSEEPAEATVPDQLTGDPQRVVTTATLTPLEEIAVNTLNMIRNAQEAQQLQRGEYAELKDLSKFRPGMTTTLSTDLSSGAHSGYTYDLVMGADTYQCIAWPTDPTLAAFRAESGSMYLRYTTSGGRPNGRSRALQE